MNSTLSLEDGGWTPALRQMSIDLMETLINRPSSLVISDPRSNGITFQSIRDKIMKKKYSNLEEWKKDMIDLFEKAHNSNDYIHQDVSEELKKAFMKEYELLDDLSHFKFRTAMTSVVKEIEEIKKNIKD